ncbi:MAG: hypothetical protein A2117_01390 [Candidatus Wildermuthbacteria bacterium GWA2_46_15]|uniref:Type I restriction modification DNA specificity domain-containing protein n=1 Tax=Candidatus Wildermuthbacteria bacterium GWA2_46_15 TaxID=1802443 RepID=A0A1G2QQ55_9BACT|nr:MAG: hypothetical protein A2117_01390 [Candidatus Wildermuthbacteria bacterium GWA2_46_15]
MKTGWKQQKLHEVCVFINRGISPKYTEKAGVCVLNQKCIRDHKINYSLSRRHDVSYKPISEERFIRLGDVLVNSTGTGTLGRVAQVRKQPAERTIVDSHITIVRPRQEILNLDFFGYMLVAIEDLIKEAGEGCGGQTELARSTLAERFSVTYPISTSEQCRIAKTLDKVVAETHHLESLYNKKLASLDELKKSVLHKAFNGAL